MSAVKKGDTLIIPFPFGGHKNVKIEWSQDLHSVSENYVVLLAENESDGGSKVPLLIAADWYNEGKLNELCQKSADGELYKLVIDSRSQYGQKSESDENRFVIIHDVDKGAKVSQVQLEEEGPVLQPEGTVGVAGIIDFGQQVAVDVAKTIIGDILRAF